jgi:putative transposase
LARKKTDLAVTVAETRKWSVKTVTEAMGVSRSNVLRRLAENPNERSGYVKAADALLEEIAAVVDARGSYGYRRVAGLISRARETKGESRVNHKRVYRVMKRAGLPRPAAIDRRAH